MTQQEIKTLTAMAQNTQSALSEQLTSFKAAMDARFEQIDQRFNKLEFRMDRFEERLEQFELNTNARLDRVNAALDRVVGQLERDDSERVALSAQVTRHEDWLVKNVPALGVTYTPGRIAREFLGSRPEGVRESTRPPGQPPHSHAPSSREGG
jgi:uncharacterized protein (DUF3084 family)